ncbi:MAG: helix-turn-helix transcriptional regulator [Clostridia bacterium]|nr:helix-turn-helix transcriptional regulator [Clostridia bacterium]
MVFNVRQKTIIEIVKNHEPITSEKIAQLLNVTRSTLRTDLSILTKMHVLEARPKVGFCFVGDQVPSQMLSDIEATKVNDLMGRAVAIDEKVSVYDAVVTMFLEDVGTIFVLSEGYLAGVISRKDFIKSAIGGGDLKSMPIGMIMTRMPNLLVTETTENILAAAKRLIDHEIDCMPVVEREEDGQMKVVGRLSKTNITQHFVDIFMHI